MGVLWCLGTGGVARAESWIVAWKEQSFHSDASAKAFVADRMQDMGAITWFYKGTWKKGFAKNEVFHFVSLEPGVPAELTNPEQCSSLKYQCEKLGGFARQYPNSAEILNPQLTAMRGMIENFQAGKAYFAGHWIAQSEYDTLIAKRNQALHSAAVQRQELERKQALALELQRLAAHEQHQVEARKLAYATVAGLAIYLVFLIGGLARGLRKLVWLLLLLPCVAAGWFTYQEGGYDWTSKLLKHLTELPAHLKLPEPSNPPTHNPP